MATHSYEEIRAAVCKYLEDAQPHISASNPMQFANLDRGVANCFGQSNGLDRRDADLLLEVFWSLFQEGVITLGFDSHHPNWPFFRVSRFGMAILQSQNLYFFHDVSTYEKLLLDQVPSLDATTLLYVKEAMQAFRSGCILSATVMLGVATEHTFLSLLEVIDNNPKHQATYAAVQKERSILPKINRFRPILEAQLSTLPREVKEDLDTQFAGIQSVIRTFRNDSGHPTGTIVSREQAYVLLHLFIPYAKKMYQLIDHFKQP